MQTHEKGTAILAIPLSLSLMFGLVTLNWTVFKRTVTIENQEMW